MKNKFSQYLASLLPSIEKDRVLEDIRLRRSEITQSTEPAYDGAAPFLSRWTVKSKEVKELETVFQRVTRERGNMFTFIHKSFPVILKNLDEVEKLIESTYNEEVAGAGLTYLKSNLLQFVECTGFVARFARKLLSYVYIFETAEYQDGGTVVADSLTPAERQYIELNFANFCQALVAVSGNPANVKHALSEVPDVVVTVDNAESLGKTMGEDKIDPLGMGFITGAWSPIYHIRMMVAEWQSARHKEAQEELAALQLRKLNLEQVHAGKPDAAVQKKLDALERRIQDQAVKLKRMEKDYA